MQNHHAQLLRSSTRDLSEVLAVYKSADEFEVCHIQSGSLGIPEVRKLIAESYLRPNIGEYRIVVVMADAITTEAQQALLKILEEPPSTAHFLFVLPAHAAILPTVLSRFSLITTTKPASSIVSEAFGEFLGQSFADRQTVITSKMTKKDGLWVEEIKTGLAAYLAQVGFKNIQQPNLVLLILTRLGTRGASNKMLLEALAFTLPSGQIIGRVVH